MRGTVFLGAVLLAASVSLAEDAKEALKSGPQAGKGISPFNVKDITGPNKGKGPLCYVWRNGNQPVVLVFTREIDKGLTGLVKEIESALKGQKNTTAFLVLQDKDQKAASEKLNKLAAETKATFPLTVAEDGEKSPSGYDLAPKVKHTILVYSKKKVVNNFALNEITEGDLKAIVEAAKKNMEAGKSG